MLSRQRINDNYSGSVCWRREYRLRLRCCSQTLGRPGRRCLGLCQRSASSPTAAGCVALTPRSASAAADYTHTHTHIQREGERERDQRQVRPTQRFSQKAEFCCRFKRVFSLNVIKSVQGVGQRGLRNLRSYICSTSTSTSVKKARPFNHDTVLSDGGMWVPVVVRLVCKILYSVYLLSLRPIKSKYQLRPTSRLFNKCSKTHTRIRKTPFLESVSKDICWRTSAVAGPIYLAIFVNAM